MRALIDIFHTTEVDPRELGLDPGGSGTSKLSRAAIIVAGVASLVATLLSCFSIWLQLKNYRKPLLQRYVVRILLMVPIYALSSWISLVSLKAAFFVDPIRDIYEAFTIYTFFQLLINYMGGERSLIIMMHGRAPKEHVWPLNLIFPKVDISDPHTFLAIKRGILQYTWLKPILALATIIMKATGTYQEGYVGLKSGYFWSGIIYNISVTLSLYSLGMFWICMAHDLKPFRPVPKFLSVKLIIFASYWQGFFLSILVWLGVIHDVGYYTPDNIARAIQDVLICFELPGFAVAHWYAFSWKDYADQGVSAARLPVYYAFRDAFGVRDLVEDSKLTFRGKDYEYRLFDPGENVLAHPESGARVARMMEGMRYERGGKGKYWIPKPTARTGLLSAGPSERTRALSPTGERGEFKKWSGGGSYGALEDTEIDPEDETLFENARALEFGDYNYPVVTIYEPWQTHRCSYNNPTMSYNNRLTPTPTANSQNLIHHHNHRSHPPSVTKSRKSSHSSSTPYNSKDKGKSKENDHPSPLPISPRDNPEAPLLSHSSSSSSRSGLVDLVVEDYQAEQEERDKAKREGGPNVVEAKKFMRLYPPEREEISAEPEEVERFNVEENSGTEDEGGVRENGFGGVVVGQIDGTGGEEGDVWRDGGSVHEEVRNWGGYGSLNEERGVWERDY